MDRPSLKRPRTGGEDAHSLREVRPRPSSGFYGVYANKKRWKAKICYGVRANGKRWIARINYDSKDHHLGSFDTKQEAALAYDREASQCGEDKPLNYESIAAAEEAAAAAATSAQVLGGGNGSHCRARS